VSEHATRAARPVIAVATAWEDREMADEDIERRVRKLTVEHAETRWLALRLDDDIKEVRDEVRAVQNVQTEHTARFDSVDMQLRSLIQLVGQVLERMPEDPDQQENRP
jgi:hypothetical protein